MTNMVQYARMYAYDAHQGQTRRDGTMYFRHPSRVVGMLERFGVTNPIILCAGYLHDVVEDTKITMSELTTHFPAEITTLVGELTIDKDDDYFKKIEGLSPEGAVIKLADILDNITDMKGIKEEKKKKFVTKKLKALEIVIPKVMKNDVI